MSISTAKPPLAGVRVVDWTHVLAGPFASYNLALLGADVIRIERADAPDIIRAAAQDPALGRLELGEAFVMQGAGKRSIAVDARDPRVRLALERLVAGADVLLENFRPGKLADLGFDPRELVQRHPRLVVCSISGFGQSGPLSDRPAYDHVIQAMSGIMAANCDRQGQPMRIGLPLVDYATGMQAALAILAALHRRDVELQAGTRERGEWLDVSMHGVALTLSAPAFASHAVSGIERKASRASAFSGNPLSGTFPTAQGQVAFVCNTQAQDRAFFAFLRGLGTVAGTVDALERHCAARDVEAVHGLLQPLLLQRPAAEWEALLSRAGIPASAVRSPTQAYEQARADDRRWPAVTLDGADGRRVQVPGPGFTSDRRLVPELAAPPTRGRDTRDVLREAGLDDEAIDALFADGAAVSVTREEQPA